MQQKKPNQEPPIDLVEQFYKENVDLKAILNARKAKKEVTSGLEPYTGEFGPAQKKHLLNRTMVGMAKRHMDDLEGLSLEEAIDLIFTPEELDEPVNDYYNDYDINQVESYDDAAPGESWVNAPEPAPWPRRSSYYAWIRKKMTMQKTSLHWKLFIFYHNLLPTTLEGTGVKGRYENFTLLFNSCFREYKGTIKDVTLDANMMTYLNLNFSKKESPDENYARELQELFTVGKGPNSLFTEDDVVAFSKILVGWHSDFYNYGRWGKLGFRFDPWNHDASDKKLSDFYGGVTIKGREGEDGAKEFDELLDVIFKVDETAMYLSRRLYQFFVYPVISELAEVNVINPLAEILRDNNYRLDLGLKRLLMSSHFYDNTFYNGMIKSPIEFTLGIIKEFDFILQNPVNPQDIPQKYTDTVTKDYYFFNSLDRYLRQQGFDLGDPPSVSGWPAYYQPPVYDLFWINSDTISKRAQFGNEIGRWGLYIGHADNEGFISSKIDVIAFLNSLNNPSNLESLIDEIWERLISYDLNNENKDKLKLVVLGGENISESYYESLYNDYINNPNENNKWTLEFRINNLFGAMFQFGEIHIF